MPPHPTATPLRAISIRQPFVELILTGKKTIEYRSRKTNIRERVYIYASLTPGDQDGFDEIGKRPGELPTGVIVGTVENIDCTGDEGDYECHLANPIRLATTL